MQCFFYDHVKVHRVNGVAVKVEGDPDGMWQSKKGRFHPICANGQSGLQRIYDPWRIKAPLKRTNPEKGPGVDPKWVEISWDEAYNTVADMIKKVRAKGKDAVFNINQSGHCNQFGSSFASAMAGDGSNVGMGMSWCEAGHYSTVANSGMWVPVPDYELGNYLIQATSAQGGGDGSSYLTGLAGGLADAKRRGMKVVNLFPVGTAAAVKADEWIPTAPATDGAFALGMLYVLLHELGVYDAEFLKNWTNGPYLVGSDGYYARDSSTQKPLVWDAVDNVAKTYDDETVKDYALEGTYTVDGKESKPAFTLLKERLKNEGYTPEWAAKICDASAQDIRRIAKEWGDAAQIGSTITISGKRFPYRPVSLDHGPGSASGRQYGFQKMGMPWNFICTLVGAQSVPGSWFPGRYAAIKAYSPQNYYAWKDGLIGPLVPSAAPFKYPPTTDTLAEFFPVASMTSWIPSLRMAHPDKYWAPRLVDLVLLRKANPLLMNYGISDLEQLYATMPVISIADLLDETGLYADIVIPETTTYEAWMLPKHTDLHVDVKGWINQPVIAPLYNLPNLLDIYIEIADRAGFLYGKGGLNDRLNGSIPTADQKLDLTKKPTSVDVVDRISRSTLGKDLEWTKQNGGVEVYRDFTKEIYEPYRMINSRLPIYMEWHKKVGDELKKNMDKAGIQWDYAGYDPLPRWIPSYTDQDTPPYDLVTVPYRKAGFSATSSRQIPLLMEVQDTDPYTDYVWMNEDTARVKGISNGDQVWVESVQGKVQAIAKLSQAIHPKAVGICINMGGWAGNEVVKSYNDRHLGVDYMRLRPWGFDYCDKMVGNLVNNYKVSVYKA
jgi:anaerobic selenocysteine-containing dehydrogenase